MTYFRTIPRDLFNEAKLLKCLGKIYIEGERQPEGVVHIDFYDNGGTASFDIKQDESDGSIYVDNVAVFVNRHRVRVFTGLNARRDWPMYAQYGDDVVEVFDDLGFLTSEFLAIGKEKAL